MNDEIVETDLLELDWENISEKEKKQIIYEYSRYVNLEKRTISAAGSYVANIRSLVTMLLASLIMALQGFENRTIALTIVGFQFIKTIFSRLMESYLRDLFQTTKQEFITFIKRKSSF
jgi:hypothetical protein